MKKFFFFAIVTAAVMIGLSACVEKLEPEVLPEIIESEVTGRGMDAITATSSDKDGVKTQELSYKSWIKVKGQTKASFDNTVEIKLTNTLVDADTTTFYRADTVVVWGNIDPNDYVTRIDYRVRGTRTEGYVTITDSVLVYTIDYGGFYFNYELDYEVAVYDDGVTREVMPYHRIESIVDKGATFTRLETTDDGKYVYARKNIEHTIVAECNGKSYEVKASILVCKVVSEASQPYVKRSEVLSSHCFCVGENVVSFIEVNRTWSDGREETKDIQVQLIGYIEDLPFGVSKVIHGYSVPLNIISSSLGNGRRPMIGVSEQASYVFCEYVYQNWNIQYNYFDIDIELCHVDAYYDDYYTCYKFPSYEFSDITNLVPQVFVLDAGEDENGHFQDYRIEQTVKATFGDFVDESTAVFFMTSYE